MHNIIICIEKIQKRIISIAINPSAMLVNKITNPQPLIQPPEQGTVDTGENTNKLHLHIGVGATCGQYHPYSQEHRKLLIILRIQILADR